MEEGEFVQIGPTIPDFALARNYGLSAASTEAVQDLPARRQLAEAVKEVNKAQLFGEQNEVTIALDRQTKKPVIRVVNRETRDLVKQIPNEYLLSLADRQTSE